MISSFNDWFENQSVGVQSVILVAFIIVSWTAITLFFVKLGQIMNNKKQKKHDKKMNAVQMRNAIKTKSYLSHPLTKRITDMIKNDTDLVSVKLSFWDIVLYYHDNEKNIMFYEWNFDSVPACEYRQFAEAVCQLLGNRYQFEMSEHTTDGIITVLKGE